MAHVRRTVESDPTVTQWHFVVDILDIHRSASLVRYVAALAGCTDDLGVKYIRGVLRSKASRAAFLTDPTHPVVFHYTPRHAAFASSPTTTPPGPTSSASMASAPNCPQPTSIARMPGPSPARRHAH